MFQAKSAWRCSAAFGLPEVPDVNSQPQQSSRCESNGAAAGVSAASAASHGSAAKPPRDSTQASAPAPTTTAARRKRAPRAPATNSAHALACTNATGARE